MIMDCRMEHDTMGEVAVPADRLWGAQTQRSLEHFKIGTETMPMEIIRSLAALKKACALANRDLGKLTNETCLRITKGADAILSGQLDDHFPLAVWQTGSGTQTNMNVNEVIANYARADGQPALHPNDDVNASQSSNDTFPAAMHIAAVCMIEQKLLPALEKLAKAFGTLEAENAGVIKLGRTHLQDATPIRFSQEISGWRAMLADSGDMIRESLAFLRRLAIGGTAVGTGLNAPAGYDRAVCEKLTEILGTEFVPDENKFHALTSRDAMTFAHGGLKALAANLMKIANDIRWLASGPRCGLGEITLPANEPGSSIMPGKVNPTQCEAVTMVAVQVMANDTAIGMAASQGNFELNVFAPVCAYNFIQSVRLLSDVMDSFEKNCVCGIRADARRMGEHLDRSLMLVTGLTPYVGYEKAAAAAEYAHEKGIRLKEAVVELELMTAEEFDRAVDPEKMV